MAENDFTLTKYDAMCKAIAECVQIDEAEQILDRTSRLEAYYRQAENKEAEEQFGEIRLRIYRKLSELRNDMKAKGELPTAGRPLKEKEKLSDGADNINIPLESTKVSDHDTKRSRQRNSEIDQFGKIPQPEFEEIAIMRQAYSNPSR